MSHHRPEIQVRHTAFKRGSAYLERYCMLIAFTAYLEDCRRRNSDVTFEDWMAARPDLCQARNSIMDNPAGAPLLSWFLLTRPRVPADRSAV